MMLIGLSLRWNAAVIYDLTLLVIFLRDLPVISDFLHLLLKELLESDIIHGIITSTVIRLLLPIGNSGYLLDSFLFLGHHAGEQAVSRRASNVVKVVGPTWGPPLLFLLGFLHWGLSSIGFGHLPLSPVVIELLQPLPLLLFFCSSLRSLIVLIQADFSIVSTDQRVDAAGSGHLSEAVELLLDLFFFINENGINVKETACLRTLNGQAKLYVLVPQEMSSAFFEAVGLRKVVIFQLRVLEKDIAILRQDIALLVHQIAVLVHCPTQVVFHFVGVKNDVPVVINVECPQNVIQLKILASDLSLALQATSLRVIPSRARKLRKIVNQIPQQISSKGRVVLDGPVLLGENQIIISIEGVISDADISFIGLSAACHILLI